MFEIAFEHIAKRFSLMKYIFQRDKGSIEQSEKIDLKS